MRGTSSRSHLAPLRQDSRLSQTSGDKRESSPRFTQAGGSLPGHLHDTPTIDVLSFSPQSRTASPIQNPTDLRTLGPVALELDSGDESVESQTYTSSRKPGSVMQGSNDIIVQRQLQVGDCTTP